MKTYHFEKLPQTIRVNLDDVFYALIVPDPRQGINYRDFYLVNEATGEAVFMFGLDVDSDEHAAELAATNAEPFAVDFLVSGQDFAEVIAARVEEVTS